MNDRKNWLYFAITLAVVVAALRYLLPSLFPFLLAVVIAFIIDPLVNALERRGGLPRGVAVGMALLGLLALMVGIFFLVASRLVSEIVQLSKLLPSYYSLAVTTVEDMLERFGALPEPVRSALQVQGERLLLMVEDILQWLLFALRQIPSTLLGTIVTFLAAFFMSRDKEAIMASLLALVPTSARTRLIRARRELVASTFGLAKAALTLMGISTLLTIFGLAVAGVQFAIVMGLVVGFFDLLPIVGPSTVFWPWIGYNLLFGSPWLALKLLVVLAAVSFTRTMLEPRIIGARIGVHPLATLVAIYLGVRLFGFIGFIIGPLVAILIKCAMASGLIGLPSGKADIRDPRP